MRFDEPEVPIPIRQIEQLAVGEARKGLGNYRERLAFFAASLPFSLLSEMA